MNPKQVTVIYYFCGKKGCVCEVLGEKEEHQQSGGQDCVQPFPSLYPCWSEDLVHAVQDRVGPGHIVLGDTKPA